MGKKINPTALRLGINIPWRSRWINAKHAPLYLQEDGIMRNAIQKAYAKAGIDSVEIERFSGEKIKITITTSRPGIVIGREGKGLKGLRVNIDKQLKVLHKEQGGKAPIVDINVIEFKRPNTSAAILAQLAAAEIERRLPARSVLKRSIFRATQNKEVIGVKIQISGRLNGAEIHRSETATYGKVPLSTMRAQIDYAEERAACTYGITGIKVWVYKGDQR